MSNDLIKAAEEARKFVRSMQSLCAVADMLEDAGSVEQAKNETLNAVEKARKELAELKAECSAMKEAAEKTLAEIRARVRGEADEARRALQGEADRLAADAAERILGRAFS